MPPRVRRSQVTHPSTREQRRLSGRLSNLQPETLTAILNDAERGRVHDWADLCDRMTQQDAHIKAELETRVTSVGGARWELSPRLCGDPARDAFAPDAAAFCEQALRNIGSSMHPGAYRGSWRRTGFEQAVLDLLDGIGVGFAVSEIDWHYDGQFLLPVNLRWVHQRRFEFGDHWDLRLMDDGKDVVAGLSQQGFSGPDLNLSLGVPLSDYPRKFIVHMPRIRPGYAPLAGCLRPVAFLYMFKRWCTQFWVSGAENFASPILLYKALRSTKGEARRKAQRLLDQITHAHKAVVDIDPRNTDLKSPLELIHAAVDAGMTWSGLIEMINREISKAILGSVDQSEPTDVGAWKAVESRKGTTVDARTAVDEKALAETIERDLLTPILELNTQRFGGLVPPTPEIRWAVDQKRREIKKEILAAGVVTVNEVRRSLGFEPFPGEKGQEIVKSAGSIAAATGMLPAGAQQPPEGPEDDAEEPEDDEAGFEAA